jgi:hypothetical protein
MSTENLKQEIKKLQKEVSRREKLQEKFPDLKEHKNRWGTIRLQSKIANSMVNKIDLIAGCGCCNDAPIYAYPYLEFAGEKIYSDPAQICVAEKIPGEWDKYYWFEEWEKTLKDIGINQVAIDSIKTSENSFEEECEEENDAN